jgi:cobalt-zinc-cadmium efflux system membrane fusion protein
MSNAQKLPDPLPPARPHHLPAMTIFSPTPVVTADAQPNAGLSSGLRWLAVGAAGLLALGAAALLLLPRSQTEAVAGKPTLVVENGGVTLTPDAPQWKYVELAVAKEGPQLPPLPAPGRVAFDEKRTSNVGTPLAGRIEAVMVRIGDGVKPGDRLFSVRSGAFADLDRELESARAAVATKRRLAERTHELVAIKASPEKDAFAADAELKDAELTLKAAQAKRESLAVQADGDNLFWVKAPRAGTVVDLDVNSSQEVTPDREKPLLRISDLAEVLVLADVQENDALDLKAGQAVRIRAQVGGLEREGVVDHVSEVIDPQRRTVEVRVHAANADHALRPNAFVEVALQADAALKRVRVPNEAVVSEGSKSLVFVSRGPGRLEGVAVVPGRQRDGEVELKTGLEPGASYVSKGALLLLNQIDLVD